MLFDKRGLGQIYLMKQSHVIATMLRTENLPLQYMKELFDSTPNPYFHTSLRIFTNLYQNPNYTP